MIINAAHLKKESMGPPFQDAGKLQSWMKIHFSRPTLPQTPEPLHLAGTWGAGAQMGGETKGYRVAQPPTLHDGSAHRHVRGPSAARKRFITVSVWSLDHKPCAFAKGINVTFEKHDCVCSG